MVVVRDDGGSNPFQFLNHRTDTRFLEKLDVVVIVSNGATGSIGKQGIL